MNLPMEIPPGIGNIDLSNSISVAVARKSLDATRDQGKAMVGLIEAAAETARDLAASPPGVGVSIDVRA